MPPLRNGASGPDRDARDRAAPLCSAQQ